MDCLSSIVFQFSSLRIASNFMLKEKINLVKWSKVYLLEAGDTVNQLIITLL